MGVGTLFYVLIALSMPLYELVRSIRGESSAERWRVVAVQFSFAIGIIFSIALADRVLVAILGAASPNGVGVAALIRQGFMTQAPQSVLASPVTASLILLAGILLSIEILRFVVQRQERLRAKDEAAAPASGLASYDRPAA